MNENLGTDNSGIAVADNEATQPAATSTETGATNGQAHGGAPNDEIFKGVDPNRLPPEAKAAYDSMLKDYREKTARLSETVKSEAQKATEAYRSKAELYDQIATQEEFVRQWNDYVQKSQSNGTPTQGDPKLAQLEAKFQEINQKIQMSELSQLTDSFADAVDEKGAKIHEDFDQLNSIHMGKLQNGGEVEEFSLLRACIELSQGNNPQERLANGYKLAKGVRDQIYEEGRKAGMGRLQTKVLNGSLPPSNSSSDVISVTDKKPKSAREALAMARRGQMVSRD